ncbi:MAG TPA: class II aldolase, partial [Marinobacter adhaerens]|nr:class II aldolase [Marinobacter adhaerens]
MTTNEPSTEQDLRKTEWKVRTELAAAYR